MVETLIILLLLAIMALTGAIRDVLSTSKRRK